MATHKSKGAPHAGQANDETTFVPDDMKNASRLISPQTHQEGSTGKPEESRGIAIGGHGKEGRGDATSGEPFVHDFKLGPHSPHKGGVDLHVQK